MQHLADLVFFYLFKQNKFQLKVGTFAQKKSLSTLLVENCLANWQISSESTIVVVRLCDVIQKGSQVCMTRTSLCKIRPTVNCR